MKNKILFAGVMLGAIFTPIISIAATPADVLATKIPKVGEWYDAPGSNITRGLNGTIFETTKGDIYAMGKRTGLQVLKQGEKIFKLAPGTKITNGDWGTIFETKSGDLYAMGWGSKLEVLKQGEETFVPALGSKIIKGAGTIFQASNGDLYAMGNESKLEVLKQGEITFALAPGSKITDGYKGTIFQAKNGDIYAMGNGSKLEVLRKGTDEFVQVLIIGGLGRGTIFQASNEDLYVMRPKLIGKTSKLEVLKQGEITFAPALGSKITNGVEGTIFQAKNGDIYAMGLGSNLQVLKTGKTHFENALGSKITNGRFGTIFQASNGDLYAMGFEAAFEVLKQGESNFKKVPGSKIIDGDGGLIFETKSGDLYATGWGSKLEVLKKGKTHFIDVLGSLITHGGDAVIFEARNGDLYAMGRNSKLQILENNELEFEISHETSKSKNDGFIKIKNFINDYSKLQYKNSLGTKWTNLPSNGRIVGLTPGRYNFQWVGKNDEVYTDGSLVINLQDQIIKDFKTVILHNVNAKIKIVSSSTISNQPSMKEIVDYGATPKESNINPPTQDGYFFAYKKATPVNDAGKSTITYDVNVDPPIKEATTQEITFVVGGFQTKVEADTLAKSRNLKIILGTTIPFGLISLVGTIWLTKHFFFKGWKKHKKMK